MEKRKYEEYRGSNDKTWMEIIDDLIEEKRKGNLVHVNIGGHDLYSDTITYDSAYMELVDMTKDEFDYYFNDRYEVIRPIISECYIDVIKDENFKSYVQRIVFAFLRPIDLQNYDLVVKTAYGLKKRNDGFYGVRCIYVDRIKNFNNERKKDILEFINEFVKDEYKDELLELLELKPKQK